MKLRTTLLLAVGLLLGIGLASWYAWLHSIRLWSSTMGPVTSASPDELIVMRTPGGLLEVSRIEATEIVQTKFVHSILSVPVGTTIPQIRVPAVYRYHIELAPEWRILRTADVFTVITPPVKPSLPVAVDLRHLERQVSGTWALIPFTGTDALAELQQEVTDKLEKKAMTPAYIQLQRAAARLTVGEFVRKWLVTQVQWRSASQPSIRVLFADEPLESLGPDALPQLQPATRAAGSSVPRAGATAAPGSGQPQAP